MIKTALKLSALAGPAVAAVIALTPAVASASCVDTHVRHGGNVPPLTLHSVSGVSCQTGSNVAYDVDSYHFPHTVYVGGLVWSCNVRQESVPGSEDPVGVVTCVASEHPFDRVVVYLSA